MIRCRAVIWAIAVFCSAALQATAMCGASAAEEVVYVNVIGGDWADSTIKAYFDAFQKETGIKPIAVRDFLPAAKLRLLVESGHVDVDVGHVPWNDYLIGVRNGWLDEIDYSGFKPQELEGIGKVGTLKYGVAQSLQGNSLAYNTKTMPESKRPKSWAEFWDVKSFPGSRVLRGGWYGSGAWEEALLADGVPMDKLYPLDIDRAFKSFNKIKAAMTKWWKEGAEGQQLFADGVADVGQAYSHRIASLAKAGHPVAVEWNQTKVQMDFWAIPKGAKNRANANKFIEFATRASSQAAFTNLFDVGPSNSNTYKLLSPEVANRLPTNPAIRNQVYLRNDEWYAQRDADGKSNLEKLIARWNSWVLEP
jgi:putative spermidine/putrescine transport system substrate-binding protein